MGRTCAENKIGGTLGRQKVFGSCWDLLRDDGKSSMHHHWQVNLGVMNISNLPMTPVKRRCYNMGAENQIGTFPSRRGKSADSLVLQLHWYCPQLHV